MLSAQSTTEDYIRAAGLKETFIKRYIVERTNKAEIRPEEKSEKAESYRENLWNEIQLKGRLSGLIMLYRHSVGTSHGNELTRLYQL